MADPMLNTVGAQRSMRHLQTFTVIRYKILENLEIKHILLIAKKHHYHCQGKKL